MQTWTATGAWKISVRIPNISRAVTLAANLLQTTSEPKTGPHYAYI